MQPGKAIPFSAGSLWLLPVANVVVPAPILMSHAIDMTSECAQRRVVDTIPTTKQFESFTGDREPQCTVNHNSL